MSGSLWHGRMIKAMRARREVTASSVLYIGNLPFDATDEQLNDIIKPLEDRRAFRWHANRETGLRNSFAHLEFKDNAAAEKAYLALKGTELSGRFLAVDYAPPSKNRRTLNRGPRREFGERRGQEEKASEERPAPETSNDGASQV
jgi:cleavage stimulation factor subunit 2